ncbi:MAG: hypothetical protein JRF40_13170, partial [Deltaproteobacteria bacterium]|nr:hypothetical protein [Deltaproteobacteria bacterium]
MPVQEALKNRFLPPALLCLFVFFMYGAANEASSSDIDWQTLETRHAIVRYQSLEDLRKFNKKIKYRAGHSGFKGLFSSSGSSDLADTVSKKVDALFERAQQILDMRKK